MKAFAKSKLLKLYSTLWVIFQIDYENIQRCRSSILRLFQIPWIFSRELIESTFFCLLSIHLKIASMLIHCIVELPIKILFLMLWLMVKNRKLSSVWISLSIKLSAARICWSLWQFNAFTFPSKCKQSNKFWRWIVFDSCKLTLILN